MAKLIIKLINDVARAINNDPIVADRLKLLLLPNYNVSLAEKIVPAANLSEQISTAGMEASGTGSMKLSLNGALTIGTLDGANIEIRAAVGAQNFFSFGLTVHEIANLVWNAYDPMDFVRQDPELEAVIALLASGFFSPEHPERYREIAEGLTKRGEKYCVLADFRSYLDCQDKVEALYLEREEWSRRAILNVAHMGMFSSDRAVAEYARKIWLITPGARDRSANVRRGAVPNSGADCVEEL
jgi:starch phosphorylase